MPALSFQRRFVPAIENGTKRQTIRAERKRPIHVGDKLYLYSGMRTKQCRKIMDTVCISAEYVHIDCNEVRYVNGDLIVDLDGFAKQDGFYNFNCLVTWFMKNHELPFYGQVIKWSIPADGL